MNQLISILNSIKANTNIDINCYSDDFKFEYCEDGQKIIYPSVHNFSDIYRDKSLNRTFFRFKYHGGNFVASISGSTEIQQNYCYFLISLIENYKEANEGLTKDEKLQKILIGEYSRDSITKYLKDYNIEELPCFVMTFLCDEHVTKIYEHLLKKANLNDGVIIYEENIIAFLKTQDQTERFYPLTYAQSLHKELTTVFNTKITIGVGATFARIYGANTSFKQALSAMKMNSLYFPNYAIHSFNDYMLVKILEEVPKYRLNAYLDLLLSNEGKAILDDKEMVETCQAFFENDLNISEASRGLYMHRNTLMYRLDKIERATKLNIKKFPDAVTFRMLTIMKKLLS